MAIGPARLCLICRTPCAWTSADSCRPLDEFLTCSEECEAQRLEIAASQAELARQTNAILRDAAWLEALPSTALDTRGLKTTAMLRTERDVTIPGTFVTHSLWASTALRYTGFPTAEDLRLSVPRLLLKRLPRLEWLDRLCERLEECLSSGRRDSAISVELAPPTAAQRWRGATLSVLQSRGLRSSSADDLGLQPLPSACSWSSPRVLDRLAPTADGSTPAVERSTMLRTPSEVHARLACFSGGAGAGAGGAGSSAGRAAAPLRSPHGPAPTTGGSPPLPGLGWLQSDVLLTTTPTQAGQTPTGPETAARGARRWVSPLSPLLPFSPLSPENARRVKDCRNALVVVGGVVLVLTMAVLLVRMIFVGLLIHSAEAAAKLLFYDVKMCARYAVAHDPRFAVRLADTGGACQSGHVYKVGSSSAAVAASTGELGVMLRLDDGFELGKAYLPVVVLGPGQYALLSISFLDAQRESLLHSNVEGDEVTELTVQLGPDEHFPWIFGEEAFEEENEAEESLVEDVVEDLGEVAPAELRSLASALGSIPGLDPG